MVQGRSWGMAPSEGSRARRDEKANGTFGDEEQRRHRAFEQASAGLLR